MRKRKNLLTLNTYVGQLEKRKGGYFYFPLLASAVEKFPGKRATRLLCTIDKRLTFPCGLNHIGDGNFFIILSSKNLKAINKSAGDKVNVVLMEDPDPLGVPIPEAMAALLDQDNELKSAFSELSMGKKRHVVHAVSRIKDIDKQVNKAITLIRQKGSGM